jgi:hypothetical protein
MFAMTRRDKRVACVMAVALSRSESPCRGTIASYAQSLAAFADGRLPEPPESLNTACDTDRHGQERLK